jgi:hypothetical protein
MKKKLEELAHLADLLDEAGLHKEADEIELFLKEASKSKKWIQKTVKPPNLILTALGTKEPERKKTLAFPKSKIKK